jgi:hypothetical protein
LVVRPILHARKQLSNKILRKEYKSLSIELQG